MTFRDYAKYTLTEFLEDDSFIQWVINPDPRSSAFWESFLINHPEKEVVVREASSLIRVYRKQQTFTNEERREDVWRRIDGSISRQAPVAGTVSRFSFLKIKSASRFSNLHEDDESIPFEVSYDQQLILNEDEARVQQIIKDVLHQLPARQQEIIFLRFYDGLSYEEIADIMCIHVSSAYKLLYKALDNLQQSIGVLSIGVAEILMRLLTSQHEYGNTVMHDCFPYSEVSAVAALARV